MFDKVTQPREFQLISVNHNTNVTDAVSVIYELDAYPNRRINFDLSHLSTVEGIKNIQTVFIDNYGNDGELIIEINETRQRIVCKPNKQGYFPILGFSRLKGTIMHNSTEQKKIPIYFLNFIVAQGAW